MNVLIMGGTQFVSEACAKYFIKAGYVVDIFTRGMHEVKYSGYREHLKGDRHSQKVLDQALSGREYEIVIDISVYTKDDVELLFNSIDKASLKHYIFCSSGSVYKESKLLLNEKAARGFNDNWGDYGYRKMEAEDFLVNAYRQNQYPVTIFRPTYIYGEGNNLYREAYLYDRIMSGQAIPIPMGDNLNQFIHIEDLLKTFESVIGNSRVIGNAYNLTHTDCVTWKELVKTAQQVLDKETDIIEIDYNALGLEVRSFFPFRNVTYILSIEKLKQDGLHIPEIDLKLGLERSFQWYRENKPSISDEKMNKVDLVIRKITK